MATYTESPTSAQAAVNNLSEVMTAAVAQGTGMPAPDLVKIAQVQATLAVAEATDRQTAAIVDQTVATDRLGAAAERNVETLEEIRKAVSEIDLNVGVDIEFPDSLLRILDRLLLASR